MQKSKWLVMDLTLFDGEAAGAAEGTQTGTKTAEVQANGPENSRRGKKSGGLGQVVYGKQAEPEGQQEAPPDAEEEEAGEEPVQQTLEERKAKFRELVNGEYKDLFTEETQRIIDRRFKEAKGLEETLQSHQPLLQLLAQRYKTEEGDLAGLYKALEEDESYWSAAADEAGMTVDQYKQMQKLQRENQALLQAQRARQGEEAAKRQLSYWYQQAEKVKEKYPDFNLSEECQNRQFLEMLRAGVPVEHAYEVFHLEDIKTGVAQEAAKRTEKQVVDDIRAKGTRPTENGLSSQSGITIKSDVSSLTKEDRQEIARRAARGEIISF